MTVHMFKCYIGRGPMSTSDLETRINNWVSDNAEWVDDPTAHSLTGYNADGQVVFHWVQVRFRKEDTKTNLYQKFTDKLKDKVDWYRVGYHNCDWDDNYDGSGVAGSECSFDANEDPEAVARDWTAKDVTIPADVPEFPSSSYDNTM